MAQNFYGKNYKSFGQDKCVFIAHSSADKIYARNVAAALMAMEVNVYFDEHDADLKNATSDEAIVRCIENGLNNSSHLLGIITKNTKDSWWVPYEIGGATGRGSVCAHLVSKDVSSIPSFIKIKRVILDQIDLRRWLSETVKFEIATLRESLKNSISSNGLELVLPTVRGSVGEY